MLQRKKILTFSFENVVTAGGPVVSLSRAFDFTPSAPVKIVGFIVSGLKTELATGLFTDCVVKTNISLGTGTGFLTPVEQPSFSLGTRNSYFTSNSAQGMLPINLEFGSNITITFNLTAYGSFILNDTVTFDLYVEYERGDQEGFYEK